MQKGAGMSRTPRPAVRKSQWKKPLTFTNQGLLGLVAWGPIEKPAAARASIGFQLFLKILGTSQGTTTPSLFFRQKADSNHSPQVTIAHEMNCENGPVRLERGDVSLRNGI